MSEVSIWIGDKREVGENEGRIRTREGEIDKRRYAYENGGWPRATCTEAASNGHLECLKYPLRK